MSPVGFVIRIDAAKSRTLRMRDVSIGFQKGTSRRYRHRIARVTLDYTFRHYGEYFIACLSYGVPLVNRKVAGVRRAQI